MGARILCIGDSYTIGEGVARRESWPHQLAERLIGSGHAAAVRVVGRTGATAAELNEMVLAAGPAPAYGVVTVQAGVNDQYRGDPIDRFAADFGTLLDTAAAATGGRSDYVLAVSIPDWSVTPHAADTDRSAAAAAVDRFNDAARRVAEQRRAGWIDVTEASRSAGALPDMLADDGLHPSGRQYRLWVAQIEPMVAEFLRS
jgi:lysophospholipase L1-like esterase